MSGSGSLLSEITPCTCFSWTSDPSELSVRGAVLETIMGQYFRLWLEDEGVFKEFYEPEGNRKIAFPEAFWMATKQSSMLFGGTGSLEPGHVFDALVIDGLSDTARQLSPEQTAERFCCIGTKDNIKARYLNGEEILE